MRTTLALLCLTLLLSSCNRHKAEEGLKIPPMAESDEPAETQAQQERVAQAFQASINPKLAPCWSKLEGNGEVFFKLTYRKAGERWEWQEAAAGKSSLPAAQQAAALDCLKKAADGSSIPLEKNESEAGLRRFVITWGWPVPLPSDTAELSRMISTGGGGGKECPKSCFDCLFDRPGPGGKLGCKATCSGYETCTAQPDGNGCTTTPVGGGRCATGWSGAWQGEIFIARQ